MLQILREIHTLIYKYHIRLRKASFFFGGHSAIENNITYKNSKCITFEYKLVKINMY